MAKHQHQKSVSIFVYGEDAAKAKALARQASTMGGQGMVLESAFVREAHPADSVKCLPCVSPHEVERLRGYWPDLVVMTANGMPKPAAPAPKPVAADPDADAKAFIATQVAGPDDEAAGLAAEAERLGVKVDGRWGAQRLREEIAKLTQAA